jgi:hypothetical protein
MSLAKILSETIKFFGEYYEIDNLNYHKFGNLKFKLSVLKKNDDVGLLVVLNKTTEFLSDYYKIKEFNYNNNGIFTFNIEYIEKSVNNTDEIFIIEDIGEVTDVETPVTTPVTTPITTPVTTPVTSPINIKDDLLKKVDIIAIKNNMLGEKTDTGENRYIPVSINKLVTQVNELFREIYNRSFKDDNIYDVDMHNIELITKFATNEDINLQKRNRCIKALRAIYRNYDNKKESIFQMIAKLDNDLKYENNNQSFLAPSTEHQIENKISQDEIESKFLEYENVIDKNSKYNTDDIKYLLLGLYSRMIPLRQEEYCNCKFVDDKEYNFCDLVNERFIMRKYKTVKTHGIREIPIPKEVMSVIYYHFQKIGNTLNNIKNVWFIPSVQKDGNDHLKSDSITKIFNNIFNKRFSIQGFRHLYVERLTNMPNMTHDKLVNIALLMGHTIMMQQGTYNSGNNK